MSAPTLPNIAAGLRAALVEVLWAQWGGLEAWPTGKPARSVVDPEALVLASLWLEPEEARLWRLLRVWAAGGARYLSVQRIKNLAPHYPATARARLGDFARECLTRGKDARWKPLVRAAAREVRERGKELEPATRITTPAALVLRLRIGLGVGIKADVLAYLLGSAGARRTGRDVALATSYARRATDRALEELVMAGFVTALATSPVSYRAPEDRWEPLLELGKDPPYWWHWDLLYRFAGALGEAAEEVREASPFLQASRARDVMAAHYAAFDLNAVPAREVTAAPGEAYLAVLAADVEELGRRMRRNMI